MIKAENVKQQLFKSRSNTSSSKVNSQSKDSSPKQKHQIDLILRTKIESEILASESKVTFKDIFGLEDVKKALNEIVMVSITR